MDDYAPGSADQIRSLAQQAARVQDLLQDLEVSVLSSGDRVALRLTVELKRAWREFRDQALHKADPPPAGRFQLRVALPDAGRIAPPSGPASPLGHRRPGGRVRVCVCPRLPSSSAWRAASPVRQRWQPCRLVGE